MCGILLLENRNELLAMPLLTFILTEHIYMLNQEHSEWYL